MVMTVRIGYGSGTTRRVRMQHGRQERWDVSRRKPQHRLRGRNPGVSESVGRVEIFSLVTE